MHLISIRKSVLKTVKPPRNLGIRSWRYSAKSKTPKKSNQFKTSFSERLSALTSNAASKYKLNQRLRSLRSPLDVKYKDTLQANLQPTRFSIKQGQTMTMLWSLMSLMKFLRQGSTLTSRISKI